MRENRMNYFNERVRIVQKMGRNYTAPNHFLVGREFSASPTMEKENIEKSKSKSSNKIVKYFKEYCDYSSIHGFKYLAEERSFYEKAFWLVAIITCAIICTLMISNIFIKLMQYPVIVTFSMQETTLYKIPFPAVTICSKARISQDYFNISKANYKTKENFTEEEIRKFNMATIICDIFETPENISTYSLLNVTEMYDFLKMSRTNFLLFCAFMEEEFPCEELTPILTEEGLCFTFNLLDKSEIFKEGVFSDNEYFRANESQDYDVEGGYKINADVHTYPRRALLPGAKNSLDIYFKTKKSDIEYECSDDDRGYIMALHLPGKIPDMSLDYFIVPLDQIVLGTIVPQVITTSDAVQVYSPEKKDCYFQSEKYLKYFKIYTQANCRLECLSNYTLGLCKCVAHFMPRFPDTPVCGSAQDDCLYETERSFSLESIKTNIKKDWNLPYENENNLSCSCLPMCTDVSYNLQISQNPWNWRERAKLNRSKNVSVAEGEWLNENAHYSAVSIFFKTDHIETKERHAVYGFTDFLSNFGGLLGLFTGFSILSLVEIVYFLTLRLICNVKKFKERKFDRKAA